VSSADFITIHGRRVRDAVSSDGTHRVMTSPDGVIWTARTAAQANPWTSVTFGSTQSASLFVAVASRGMNRVMTSSNGGAT
jgi:hypothetical protein